MTMKSLDANINFVSNAEKPLGRMEQRGLWPMVPVALMEPEGPMESLSPMDPLIQ